MVIETLSTVREEISLSREWTLWATASGADNQRIRIFEPSATTTLEKARTRVRKLEAQFEHELAMAFAERVRDLDFVKEVWAAWDPSLDVTVTVTERDLERELHLYVIFRELAAKLGDPAGGNLAVVPAPYNPEGAELLFSA